VNKGWDGPEMGSEIKPELPNVWIVYVRRTNKVSGEIEFTFDRYLAGMYPSGFAAYTDCRHVTAGVVDHSKRLHLIEGTDIGWESDITRVDLIPREVAPIPF
jgi:hypothetical protein